MSTRAQLAAWDSLQPQLTKRQEEVLTVIRANPSGATLREIADTLGVDMNQVSGRVTELVGARAVRDSGNARLNPRSGRAITVWVPVKEPVQLALFRGSSEVDR